MTSPVWDGDPAAVVQGAADVLRIASTDPDYARLGILVPGVLEQVRAYLDWPVPFDDPTNPDPIPQTIYLSAVNLTVESYRRKDSPFGISNAWGQDGVSLRIPADVLAGSLSELRPLKRQFGFA